MQPPVQYAPFVETVAPPRRRSFFGDIYSGAVRGEFDENLGPAGYTTLVLMCFIPVVGSICAVRDLIACRRHHDTAGSFLNVLAIFPELGVLPKLILAIRGVSYARSAMRANNSLPRR